MSRRGAGTMRVDSKPVDDGEDEGEGKASSRQMSMGT